jgi:hypothetical protein
MSDSDFRPGSDAEWAALLRQLREQPKAQPRPFFYARVQARLAARHGPAPGGLPTWARRPAYAALLALLVLAVSGDGPAPHPAPPAGPAGGSHFSPATLAAPR